MIPLVQPAAKVKQMIYIVFLCNSEITAEPLYNTPLFIGPYATANNTALLAWRPSQGTKLYCLVNRGTLGENNLPRIVARIMPRSESNPRPLDHESNALPLHHRVTYIVLVQTLNHAQSINQLVRLVGCGLNHYTTKPLGTRIRYSMSRLVMFR